MEIGGKAKNLVKLAALKYPVPSFITLTPEEITANNFQSRLEKFAADKNKFAVRSSGMQEDSKTKSYAGIFRTEINVSKADLTKTIRVVANAKKDAQLYTNDTQSIAVIVQEYIEAKYFGICFTNLNGDLVINIHKGIGEDLVSGKVTGEEIRINRETFTYLRKPKLLLNYSKFIRLFLTIERDFDSPQDIEFCVDNQGKFWILQTRPVTTGNVYM